MVIATCAAPCLDAPRVVNSHGEQIDSVFAGLAVRSPMSASAGKCRDAQRPFASADVLPLALSQGILKPVACDPGECCVGHFIIEIPIEGGCYMNACQVNNTEENTDEALYDWGAWPWQCSQYCCDTTRFCTNFGQGCL